MHLDLAILSQMSSTFAFSTNLLTNPVIVLSPMLSYIGDHTSLIRKLLQVPKATSTSQHLRRNLNKVVIYVIDSNQSLCLKSILSLHLTLNKKKELFPI